MNKKLNRYVNDIIAIAGANDKSWDVGCDMFLANVKNVGKDGLPTTLAQTTWTGPSLLRKSVRSPRPTRPTCSVRLRRTTALTCPRSLLPARRVTTQRPSR